MVTLQTPAARPGIAGAEQEAGAVPGGQRPPLLGPLDRLTMPAGARTVLTIDEAAETLTLGHNTVVGLLDSGELRGIYVGRRRVVPVRAIHEFIAEQMARQGQL